MRTEATSLRIPVDLKARIVKLAERSGESVHAFMLRLLEDRVRATEQFDTFADDARRADEAMIASGTGYLASDVHEYVSARLAGKAPRRPNAVRWRK
ncbi:MAG: hypothetical protein ACKVQU_02240 [Burkholderiales bacterium]